MFKLPLIKAPSAPEFVIDVVPIFDTSPEIFKPVPLLFTDNVPSLSTVPLTFNAPCVLIIEVSPVVSTIPSSDIPP